MTTSGSYGFYVTRDDIIRQALINIGKLDGVEVPEPAVTVDCARVLNMLCKQWMGRSDFAPGLKVWTRKRGHLFLSGTTNRYVVGPAGTGWATTFVDSTLAAASTAGSAVIVVSGTGPSNGFKIGVEVSGGSGGGNTLFWTTVTTSSYSSITNQCTVSLALALPGAATVGNKAFSYIATAQGQQPLAIEAAVLRNENNNDTPLDIMLQSVYDALPGKVAPATSIGDPTAIYYEFQLGNSYLYTDVGSSNNMQRHIVLTYMEPVQDFVNPTDTPYYPQEYFLALCWGLAKQVAPMFHAVWTPLMQENYDESTAIARHKDSENVNMYFQCGLE